MLERRARVLEVLDRLQEHDRIRPLGERLDQIALEAQIRAAVAQARVLVRLGVRIDADDARGAAREHVRSVALAAGHVDRRATVQLRGDPFVDDEVATKPVVLLGHVRERALAGQRERRNARPADRAARRVTASTAAPVRGGGPGAGRRGHGARVYGAAPCRSRSARRRSARRTPATTTSRPTTTTPSGASTSARLGLEPGDRKGHEGARPRARALRPLARDRRGHRLLHAQPDARGADRRGDLQRHLAGDARDAR